MNNKYYCFFQEGFFDFFSGNKNVERYNCFDITNCHHFRDRCNNIEEYVKEQKWVDLKCTMQDFITFLDCYYVWFFNKKEHDISEKPTYLALKDYRSIVLPKISNFYKSDYHTLKAFDTCMRNDCCLFIYEEACLLYKKDKRFKKNVDIYINKNHKKNRMPLNNKKTI